MVARHVICTTTAWHEARTSSPSVIRCSRGYQEDNKFTNKYSHFTNYAKIWNGQQAHVLFPYLIPVGTIHRLSVTSHVRVHAHCSENMLNASSVRACTHTHTLYPFWTWGISRCVFMHSSTRVYPSQPPRPDISRHTCQYIILSQEVLTLLQVDT